MVIITDAEENSSVNYNYSEITRITDEEQKYYNWSYALNYCKDGLSAHISITIKLIIFRIMELHHHTCI